MNKTILIVGLLALLLIGSSLAITITGHWEYKDCKHSKQKQNIKWMEKHCSKVWVPDVRTCTSPRTCSLVIGVKP